MAAQDLHALAFPRLDDTQIAALERCAQASLRRYPNGHRLLGVGERDFKFFVVKSGEVELLDESGEMPRRVATRARESSPAT